MKDLILVDVERAFNCLKIKDFFQYDDALHTLEIVSFIMRTERQNTVLMATYDLV